MSGRGLQKAAAAEAEAAGLKSASPATLQFLTVSSPGHSGDWPPAGGRQPLLHTGFRGWGEEMPRLAFLVLMCWESARYQDPLREDSGGGLIPTFSFRQQKDTFSLVSVVGAKKVPPSPEHCGSRLGAPPPC